MRWRRRAGVLFVMIGLRVRLPTVAMDATITAASYTVSGEFAGWRRRMRSVRVGVSAASCTFFHVLPMTEFLRCLSVGRSIVGYKPYSAQRSDVAPILPYFLRGRGQTNDDTLPAPQRASPFPRGNPGGHARYHVTQRAATTALFSYFSEAVAEHRAILHTLPTPCFPSVRSPVPRPLSVHARVRASSPPLPPRGYALQRPPLTRQTITSPFLLFPPPSAHSPFSTSPPHSQMTYLLRQTRHRHLSTLLLVS